MSWTAELTDDRGHYEGDWGYTHNTNQAIDAVLNLKAKESYAPQVFGGFWWIELDGMSGPDGAAYLQRIISGLEADPTRFRAMNPKNGWGGYDELLVCLRQMRDAVPEWPTTWSAEG